MTVIAMTREMGTLGKDVAMGLSVEKGMALVHHELVEQSVAERMHIGTSEVHRFLEGSESLLERWRIDATRLSRYTAEEILQIAEKGGVLIRGWGATALLADIPHVLRVRICAPMSFRVKVMMERLGVDAETARREIERNDAAHTRTIQRLIDADWQNPLHYHVVLNTACVSVANCIRVINELSQDAAFRESPDSRQALHDKIIETRILEAFDESDFAGLNSHAIDVKVRDGKATLRGVTTVEEEVAAALEIASGVKDVVEVDNRIAQAGHENVWA